MANNSHSLNNAASMRNAIYAFAARCGEHGITTDEVSAEFGRASNEVSGRLTELRKANLLKHSGASRLTRAGGLAFVLVAA